MNDIHIDEGVVPPDEKPQTTEIPPDPSDPDNPNNWHNTDYPYSTPDHPYGFFADKDGNPDFTKPRKNRPRGSSTGNRVTSGFPASDRAARTAAKLLSQMNLFIGMGISAFGLRMTAQELVTANEQFEEMAFNALLTDPKLCSKILSAGAKSGQTQLMFAYVALAGSLAPMAMSEVRGIREQRAAQAEGYAA